MIPADYIAEWRTLGPAPWPTDAQVEQDLLLSRAIVALYSEPDVARALAFRGGTALYKLYVHPPRRCSEDIDLVQREAGPIGSTIDAVRRALDGWLGQPKRTIKDGRVVMYYRVPGSGGHEERLRIKVEVNTREHFSSYGIVTRTVRMASRWSAGEARVRTYVPDELLATKLRALYQRKKGRDLFDLWTACQALAIDPARVVRSFLDYMAHDGRRVSRAEFEANLREKLADPEFCAIDNLLAPGTLWNPDQAGQLVLDAFLPLLERERPGMERFRPAPSGGPER